MKILFYFGHPSQYLFLKNALRLLREKGIHCAILIKSKDVLEKLLIENGETYINILPEGRKSGNIGILFGLLKRDFRLFKFVKNRHYDLFVGTDPSLAHIGFLKRIPVITVVEDDIHIIPKLARLTYPFTSIILTPYGCKTGKFEKKTLHYHGFMKLAYLHPNRFDIKTTKLKKPYFLIRASKLDAHHDTGIGGLNSALLKEIIHVLEKKGKVYISAEGQLDDTFKSYALQINASEMQNIIAHATMLISDSQSMSMEAAMLGVPSIRFSDFAGKISVLEELEHQYSLTFGIQIGSSDKLFLKIAELLSIKDLDSEFMKRRQLMLTDKIDVTAFLVWFIENYPESSQIIKKDPDYQLRFRSI